MSSENTSSNSGTGSDPRRLRALAHPVRLDLLYLLEREGSLTASQAAQQLGITPKACSYHLGLLGKYGVVEETGEGKGRARPWRVTRSEISYVHHPDEEPTTAHAQNMFAATVLARDARVVETFIDQRRNLPEHWRNVAMMSSSPLHLTPAELKELRTELLRVLQAYQERSLSPSEGAHPVHAALYAVPAALSDLTEPGD